MYSSIHTFMQYSKNKTVLLHDRWPKMTLDGVETVELSKSSEALSERIISLESWADRASALSLLICAKLAEHQHSSCVVPPRLGLRSKQGS